MTPHLSEDFPHLVSYTRFVELMPAALVPLCAYLHTRKGQSQGVAVIDSTLLAVCHPQRSSRHKVFAGFAAWGKNSLGWTSGFKLHFLINGLGELVAYCLTAANVDDRKPVPHWLRGLHGKVFGDRGYISQALFTALFGQGRATDHQATQRPEEELLPMMDKLLLRKRSLIETVNDQLKNISQIDHSAPPQGPELPGEPGRGSDRIYVSAKKPSLHIRMPQDDSFADHRSVIRRTQVIESCQGKRVG